MENIEIPGYFIAGLVIDIIGRIPTLAISFALCGIGFIASMYPLGFYLGVCATMVCRGSIAAAFNTIWIYTPEAYPTKIRATGMGLGSSSARVAGILTPFVAKAFIEIYYFLPFLIYIAAAFSGVVASILLPVETKGRALPDSHFEKEEEKEEEEKEDEINDTNKDKGNEPTGENEIEMIDVTVNL